MTRRRRRSGKRKRRREMRRRSRPKTRRGGGGRRESGTHGRKVRVLSDQIFAALQFPNGQELRRLVTTPRRDDILLTLQCSVTSVVTRRWNFRSRGLIVVVRCKNALVATQRHADGRKKGFFLIRACALPTQTPQQLIQTLSRFLHFYFEFFLPR